MKKLLLLIIIIISITFNIFNTQAKTMTKNEQLFVESLNILIKEYKVQKLPYTYIVGYMEKHVPNRNQLGTYFPDKHIGIYYHNYYSDKFYREYENYTTYEQMVKRVLSHEIGHSIYHNLNFIDELNVLYEYNKSELKLNDTCDENFAELFKKYDLDNMKYTNYNYTYKVIKKYYKR